MVIEDQFQNTSRERDELMGEVVVTIIVLFVCAVFLVNSVQFWAMLNFQTLLCRHFVISTECMLRRRVF